MKSNFRAITAAKPESPSVFGQKEHTNTANVNEEVALPSGRFSWPGLPVNQSAPTTLGSARKIHQSDKTRYGQKARSVAPPDWSTWTCLAARTW